MHTAPARPGLLLVVIAGLACACSGDDGASTEASTAGTASTSGTGTDPSSPTAATDPTDATTAGTETAGSSSVTDPSAPTTTDPTNPTDPTDPTDPTTDTGVDPPPPSCAPADGGGSADVAAPTLARTLADRWEEGWSGSPSVAAPDFAEPSANW